jgi:uncharacterized membrane protein YjjP (DUF1212 family)
MGNPSAQKYDLLGKLLLEIGIAMIHAGAPTRRVNLVLVRISTAFGSQIYHQMSTRHLTISLYEGDRCVFNGVVSQPALPAVNFQLVSDISDLSLKVKEERPSLESLSSQIAQLRNHSSYPRVAILAVVSLAGAAFCFTFGGSVLAMVVTFLATLAGLFLKQELVRRKVNLYITTYLSSFLASAVVGFLWLSGMEDSLEHALSTCVLFLIPGVPLVIAFVDFLDGSIINGIERAGNALLHVFGIAAGLASVVYLFKIPF